MTLKRLNILIILFLSIVVTGGFYAIYNINKEYFQQENMVHIKGDILELGYAVTKSIQQDGINSTLNLLYKSIATHKAYEVISIVMDDQIIVSTDRKKLNKGFVKTLHLDNMTASQMQKSDSFFHEFSFFDTRGKNEFLLLVELDKEYLLSNEKEIGDLIKVLLLYLLAIMILVLGVLYLLNIRPLVRLSKNVAKEDLSTYHFFIKEYDTLQNAFKQKFDEITLLNKTLEEKVFERTESLARTNHLFAEAQKMTHLGNWEWNITENILTWSDEIYRIFGLKPQEFAATYDAFMNTIHQDDRELVQSAVSKALETGEKYSIRHRIVLPNGVEKIVQEHGEVELDSTFKPVRMIGTVHDITVSFHREQELELHAQLLNSVTDSIFVHHLDGSFIYVNEAAYKTRGYSKDEMMKMNVQNLDYHDEKVGHEIYDANLKYIHNQIEDKGQATFEVSHQCKDGTVLPLEVTCKLIHEEDTSYLISIARDISERKHMSENLERSEKQYRKLVENSQMGIFNSKLTGEILYVNDTIVKILGFDSQEELYKQSAITRYKNPEQRAVMLRILTENGKVDAMELDILTKDDELRTVLFSAHIEGDILSGIIMDISQEKKAREEITKLSKAMEQIDDIVMISDRAGVLTFVNDAFIEHTGYSREEALGHSAAILKSGKHENAFYKKLWRTILSGEIYRELVVNRKKDGEIYYEEKTITPIKNEEGVISSFVSTGKDITDRVEMQQELETLASTDQLTGIYNRHKFEALLYGEMERIKRYEHPLSLMMFDIDHFKSVNDTFGHDVGDMVLTEMVNIVKGHIRASDIFVRWGGEEFLILCPETNEQNTLKLAEKLRAGIESALFGKAGHVTSSFGITQYKESETEKSFLKRVDNALYKAKDSGRNKVVVL